MFPRETDSKDFEDRIQKPAIKDRGLIMTVNSQKNEVKIGCSTEWIRTF